MTVKLEIAGVNKFPGKKDPSKTYYMLKLRDDVYDSETERWIGGVSVWIDETTYDAILSGYEDTTIRFVSASNAKIV